MAINLLKIGTTCKLGVANKRKKVGRKCAYLLRVLSGVPADATQNSIALDSIDPRPTTMSAPVRRLLAIAQGRVIATE